MAKKTKKQVAEEQLNEQTAEVNNTEANEQEEQATVNANEEQQEVADEANTAESNTEENVETAEQTTEESNKKDKKDLMIEELNDKYMRTFAEFDNFRKRTEKEKAAMFEVGAKSIVEKILPVVDNFERGFSMVAEDKMSDPFVEGMDKVYKQLMKSLEEAGVKPIAALGEEFNPDMHNAVMHVEDDSVGENIIVEEFQKGYMYRESVVRYSMVKVAN